MSNYKDIFSATHTLYRLTVSSSNLKSFINGVCRLYKQVFDADRVVMLCKNISDYGFLKLRLEKGKSYFKKGGKSIITRVENEILRQNREILSTNRMIFPLMFDDTLGAIYVKRKPQNEPFSEIEKKWFLALSEEISISLKIFNLYWEEQKAMINYIKSVTGLLDQYVPTSYLHTKCTCRLIKIIAKHMRLTELETKALEYASLLHDAGKIQVPSKLLKKQKRLTDEEFKIIQKHPKEGVALIKDLEKLKPVIPIILHHHERYDGKGYPAKLEKEQIPLGARILSIIDAFDAMYFGRPYRKRKNLKDIEQELAKQAGKQFDPKVIQVFLKVINRTDIKTFLAKL